MTTPMHRRCPFCGAASGMVVDPDTGSYRCAEDSAACRLVAGVYQSGDLGRLGADVERYEGEARFLLAWPSPCERPS